MVLIICLYLLWTFGRAEASMDEIAGACVVLGFPAALGAAASRLILFAQGNPEMHTPAMVNCDRRRAACCEHCKLSHLF